MNHSKLRDALQPRWSDHHATVIEEAMERRRVRRQRQKRAALMAGFGAATIGVCVASWPQPQRQRMPLVAALPAIDAHAPGQTRFSDGSRVQLGTPQTQLTTKHADDSLIVVQLEEGPAKFFVPPHGERTFRVITRQMQVEVMAATFTLTPEGDGYVLSVQTGGASVAGLTPGAVDEPMHSPLQVNAGQTWRSAGRKPQPPIVAKVDRDWRRSARKGNYEAAFIELSRHGLNDVSDVPAELLLAADVARLSGHPQDSLRPLERLLQKHVQDPRAPLAAFTLGRILLDSLNAPARAAIAFSKARALSPKGQLSADALIREAEAWQRAGDLPKAQQLARQYSQENPTGSRLSLARRIQAGQ